MNILITGGQGFLGKRVHENLMKLENVNIFSPSSKELDLLSLKSVESYFSNKSIDLVIHLAARLGGVGLVSQNPLLFFETNLIINYNMVSVSVKHGVKKFITIGSSCSYNKNACVPTKEENLWKGEPENSYGVCKLALLEHLKAQDKMDWVYFIPPNIYGIGDHFNEENAHLIPATFKKYEDAISSGSKNIVVWGDGTQIRDFIYVDDVADIILKSIYNEEFSKKPINISTNVGVSVTEIVEMIREFLGVNMIEIEYDTTKPTGTMKKVLDNTNLKSIIPNYRFKTFREGMEETCKWYKINICK